MRHLLLFAAIACLALLLPASSVLAAPMPPSNDSYVRSTATGTIFGTTDPTKLSVVGSTTSCNATDVTYLQWDLSAIPAGQTVVNATVTLTASTATNVSGATLGLYNVSGTWAEDTLSWSNAPGLPLAPSALLDTKSAPTSGNSVIFSSPALDNYLNTGTGAAGPGRKASFALAFGSGCNSGLSLVLFNSKESTTGTGPELQFPPATAVTLQSFGGTSTVNVGAGLPWLAVLAGVTILTVRIRHHYLPSN